MYQSIAFAGSEVLTPYTVKSIDASTDAVWIICELDIDLPLSQIEIQNTFLTEIYDDQTNLVKLITTSSRDTKRMDGTKTKLLLSMDE